MITLISPQKILLAQFSFYMCVHVCTVYYSINKDFKIFDLTFWQEIMFIGGRQRDERKGKCKRCFGLPCGVNGNTRNCQEQQFSGNRTVGSDRHCQGVKLVLPHSQDHCLALLFLAWVNWHQAPPVPWNP